MYNPCISSLSYRLIYLRIHCIIPYFRSKIRWRHVLSNFQRRIYQRLETISLVLIQTESSPIKIAASLLKIPFTSLIETYIFHCCNNISLKYGMFKHRSVPLQVKFLLFTFWQKNSCLKIRISICHPQFCVQ